MPANVNLDTELPKMLPSAPGQHFRAWKSSPSTHPRTLGGAMLMLGGVKWGKNRIKASADYVSGLVAILGGNVLPHTQPFAPNPEAVKHYFGPDAREAIGPLRMLAMQCLARGDPTPLLLTLPRDERPLQVVGEKLAWFDGYVDADLPLAVRNWDMGDCLYLGARPEPLVDFSKGKIMPRMEAAGFIETFWREGFTVGAPGTDHYQRWPNNVIVVDRLASAIIRAAKVNKTQDRDAKRPFQLVPPPLRLTCTPDDLLSAKDFLEQLNRLLPGEETRVSEFRRRKIGFLLGPGPADRLISATAFLRSFIPLVDAEDSDYILERRQAVSRFLRASETHLELDKRILEANKEVVFAGKPMHYETIAQVQCRECGKRGVYRLTIWEDDVIARTNGDPLDIAAKVYRFPGLEMGRCTRDGVGLVVQKGQIIGKMKYGSGGCDCRKMVRVDLGAYMDNNFFFDLGKASAK